MKIIRNSQVFASRLRGMTAFVIGGALAFAVVSQSAKADSLHGVCADGSSACGSAATITDTTNPPTFGFVYAGNGSLPQGGDLLLVFLVPQADGSGTGPIGVTGSASGTATLFSTTPWTSKSLDAYLGLSAQPNNPIGNYGPGFFVYSVDLGQQTLCANGHACTPSFQETSTALPEDTYILGFLNIAAAGSPADWTATANSESILELGAPPPPATPEPSSLMLLGSGILGMAGVVRRRCRC
ncbi:MAG TPA: PEP-CTERM sorting domain-containing protein [Bryocella sp.]|nr:PEP-CTERM sorting domain-containing protein [Bryocella sp.]